MVDNYEITVNNPQTVKDLIECGYRALRTEMTGREYSTTFKDFYEVEKAIELSEHIQKAEALIDVARAELKRIKSVIKAISKEPVDDPSDIDLEIIMGT